MKQILSSLALLVLSFSCAIAMDKKTEPHSIILLPNNQVAVAGTNGCTIFDRTSRKPLHIVDTEKFFDIAASKDKTILMLSQSMKNPVIYNTQTKTKKYLNEHQFELFIHITFSPINDKLFFCEPNHLYSYNTFSDQIKKTEVPCYLADRSLSHHPSKNELLLPCLDGENHALFVIQPNHTPIKTRLSLLSLIGASTASYAPDGDNIVILDQTNGQSNYLICNLNSFENQLLAHQLIADDKDYAAKAFHPQYSTIALLTRDNMVHFFDYKQRTLIAKTKKLIDNKKNITDMFEHKRLDCDGKYLAIVPKDTWIVLDVPQNNFYEIWKTLILNGLPREIATSIIANIVAHYQLTYTYFDVKALLNTTPIQQPMPEIDSDEIPMELETETKQIKAVYARPSKNPEIYDDWSRQGLTQLLNAALFSK